MKRNVFLIIVVCMILMLLSACGKSVEKEAEELNQQARTHYDNGDLESAIVVFEKSLELKEDPKVRQYLSGTKEENEAVEKVKELLEALKEDQLSLYQSSSISDFVIAGEDIEKIVDKFSRVPAPTGTHISDYLDEVKNSSDFFLIRTNVGLFLIETKLSLQNDKDNSKVTDLISSLNKFLENHPLPSFYK